LLLRYLECNQTLPSILHACGIVPIAARFYLLFGLSRTGGLSQGRLIGTAVTWAVMLVMAVLLIWQQFVR